MYGLALMLGYLGFDGFTSTFQVGACTPCETEDVLSFSRQPANNNFFVSCIVLKLSNMMFEVVGCCCRLLLQWTLGQMTTADTCSHPTEHHRRIGSLIYLDWTTHIIGCSFIYTANAHQCFVGQAVQGVPDDHLQPDPVHNPLLIRAVHVW